MTVKVALIGASGRMGREIDALISEEKQWRVSQKVGHGVGEIESVDQLNPKEVDIVIDFSTASLFSSVLAWCAKHNKPLVSGTTGLSEKDLESLESASSSLPVLWSANMSLGIAWLSEIIKQLAPLAASFDFQIEEVHHNKKIDSPSGTAKHLQQVLEKYVDAEAPQPLAIRGGGVFGIHKVWAMSDEEVITVEHQALNRTVFAKGAVKAAKWLYGKPNGRYLISSLLS